MYSEHPAFENPSDEGMSLWRYLDFTKFLFLLESSSLYFCRGDKFRNNDPFEGSFPKREYEYLIQNSGLEIAQNFYKAASKSTFINCWHLSEIESIAMWKLYSELNKGVAIKTTITNFKYAFNKTNENVFAGIVQYIDYENDTYYARRGHKYTSQNLFSLYIHKRDIFEFEKEYRAVCSDHRNIEQDGKYIEVDLNALIQEVVLAPNTSDWMYNLVNVTAGRILNDIKISRSIFDSKPYL